MLSISPDAYYESFTTYTSSSNLLGFLLLVDLFLALVLSVLIFLEYLRFSVKCRSIKRRERFYKKCYRFSRKNSYKLAKAKFNSKYCWSKFFLGSLPNYVVDALGPRITRRTFDSLLINYQTYSSFNGSKCAYLSNNHVQFCSFPVPIQYKFDNSLWVGNPQDVIDIASSVNAATFGTPHAGEIFRDQVKNAIVVNTAVTKKQRASIEAELEFPVVFKKIVPVAHDHAVVAAFREITRSVYDSCFKIQRTKLPSLVIGSAFREFTKYAANNYIHYYFHDSEAKDYDRTVRWFLETFVQHISEKAARRSNKVHRDENGEKPKVTKTFESFRELLNEYKKLKKIPDKLKLGIEHGYEILLFEDSFYNFEPRDYKEVFKSTGANVAYGYGTLPFEMIFPEMPQSRHYRLTREGKKIHMNFSYCNGYSHDEISWSTLLKYPVMNFDTFSLVFEIVSMVGPMCVFKIIKVNKGGETISRRIALPEKKKYVKVLDLINSCGKDGRITRKKYFSVFANEYFETLNYCLSIDPRALTLQNTMTFIRRRAGGVSLISKELLAPWHLNSRDFHSFALSVFIQAKFTNEHADNITSINSTLMSKNPFSNIFGFFFSSSFSTIKSYIVSNGLADKLIIFGEDELLQRYHITVANPEKIMYNIQLDETYVEKLYSCPICERLDDKTGDQVIKCEHRNHEVTISMTDNDLEKVKTILSDNDKDPAGLKNIKERARKAMPVSGFSHTCRFHYILGGPGCGKSFIIRQLATKFDLVYAPFTKLMADYKGLKDDFGENYDLNFATVHRGLETRCVSTIFIDEFTSLPMEYIKMVIAVNKAEDIFIVGDTKQTQVTESEGTYIGDEIDINSLPKHTLLRNFRNPKDTVMLLNKLFGYEMEPMSKIEKSIYVVGPKEKLPDHIKDLKYHKFTFCYGSLADNNLTDDDTVRKYQGSTVNNAMLFVDQHSSEDTAMNDNMTCVALSRHKEVLVIRHDGSERARNWLTKYKIDEEIEKEYEKHHTKADPIEGLNYEHKDTEQYIKENFKINETPTPLDITKQTGSTSVLLSYLHDFKQNMYSLLSELFTSPLHRFYISLYLLTLFLENINDNYFLSDFVGPVVRFFCKMLIMKQLCIKIYNSGKNFDFQILLFHSIIKLCLEFDSTMLHFYDYENKNIIYQQVLNFYYNFYISAKLLYITRIFSLEQFSFTNKVITLLGFGHILRIPSMMFGMNYFCDILSNPMIIMLVALMRFKNFRFVFTHYPFYSYDANTTLPIYDHKIFINLISSQFNFSNQQFTDYMFYYIPLSIRKRYEQKPVEEIKPIKPILKSGKDAYTLGLDLVPTAGQEDVVDFHNNIGSLDINEDYYTGTMDVSDFINPVSVKHKPQNTLSTFLQIIPGTGNVFNKKSIPQLLQVLGGRYFNKKPKASKPYDHDAWLLGKKIVDEFFFECMDNINLEEADLETVTNEFVQSAQDKKYENQFKGFDNFDTQTIRFHLKDIFKPKVGDIADPTKCGQGISAWNKDAQVLFGVGARFANYQFMKFLKDHCVYDNRITPTEMKEKLTQLMANLPSVCKNGITDFTMFDSQQDQFTQAIEKYFLLRLGFSEDFIEHYYMFRSNYTIIGSSIKGKSKFEKTSGEPMTLLMNTIISAVLSNYFLRGEGKFLLAMKGDDGFKRQANLKLDEQRYEEVAQYTALKMKIMISREAEFCGYVITDNLFVDSIPRKLHKLLSHHFTDYIHFTQYQQSIRDFISQFEDDYFFSAYIDANAKIYESLGCGYDEIMIMYECLKSFAHINEQQFYEQTNRVTIDSIYKTAEDDYLIQYFNRQKEIHTHQHTSTCKDCAKIPCADLSCKDRYNCNFIRSFK
jgi:hypothetical protein